MSRVRISLLAFAALVATLVAPMAAANPIDDARRILDPIVFCAASQECEDVPCANDDCVCTGDDCEQPVVQQVRDAALDAVEEQCGPGFEDCGVGAVNDALDDACMGQNCLTYAQGIANHYVTIVVNQAWTTVGPTYRTVDGDEDLAPNAAEPTLCSLQNDNSPTDGTCVGSNYDPPGNSPLP